eukprot:1061294-Alexandrium_andersonii.AAC.1
MPDSQDRDTRLLEHNRTLEQAAQLSRSQELPSRSQLLGAVRLRTRGLECSNAPETRTRGQLSW